MSTPLMTAEEFVAARYDLPESGQWAELEAGVVSHFQPPDLDHGTTILNLSKLLADAARPLASGYACFDLGIRIGRSPDTVRFPAVSYFVGGPLFAEADREMTDTLPHWVVELASSSDRRQQMSARTEAWLDRGVQLVWVIDPAARMIEVTRSGDETLRASVDESISAGPVLSDFCLEVGTLFREPLWWR